MPLSGGRGNCATSKSQGPEQTVGITCLGVAFTEFLEIGCKPKPWVGFLCLGDLENDKN